MNGGMTVAEIQLNTGYSPRCQLHTILHCNHLRNSRVGPPSSCASSPEKTIRKRFLNMKPGFATARSTDDKKLRLLTTRKQGSVSSFEKYDAQNSCKRTEASQDVLHNQTSKINIRKQIIIVKYKATWLLSINSQLMSWWPSINHIIIVNTAWNMHRNVKFLDVVLLCLLYQQTECKELTIVAWLELANSRPVYDCVSCNFPKNDNCFELLQFKILT